MQTKLKRFNDAPVTYAFTIIIILINCYVYYLEVKSSQTLNINSNTLLKFGASLGTLDLSQPLRFLTAMWLHLSSEHILSNMIALWLFARIASQAYYTWQIILIYFASGLTGTIFSAIIQPQIICAGASTAISGLIGAMIAMAALPSGIDASNIVKYGFSMLLLNTVGMIGTNTDIWGHVGGALAGLILGLAFCLFTRWHFYRAGY